jgi:hypothetical protein
MVNDQQLAHKSVLKGHGFSRAPKEANKTRAFLAPEGANGLLPCSFSLGLLATKEPKGIVQSSMIE